MQTTSGERLLTARRLRLVAGFGVLAMTVVWYPLLALAYGLHTISRSDSLSYADMLSEVFRAAAELLGRL